jgi:hypothetical protein
MLLSTSHASGREKKEAKKVEKVQKCSADWLAVYNPTLLSSLSLVKPSKPSSKGTSLSAPPSPTPGAQGLPSSLPPSLAPSPLRPDSCNSCNASPSRSPEPPGTRNGQVRDLTRYVISTTGMNSSRVGAKVTHPPRFRRPSTHRRAPQ